MRAHSWVARLAVAAVVGACCLGCPNGGDEGTTPVRAEREGRARPKARGAKRILVPFEYDKDAVTDLGRLAVSSGGSIFLAPSPEDVTAVLRSAIHGAVAHSGGRPVDIALVVDTTGSMGTAVRAAALGIEFSSRDIEASGAAVRLALMEYKDEGDDYVTKTLTDFTGRSSKIIRRLATLEASGGGDWPEAVPTVIMEALDTLSWDDDAGHTIILIADAPSHKEDERRRGLGKRAHSMGVAVDVIVVGTHEYAGGYDESTVAGLGDSGDGDDDDGYAYGDDDDSSAGTDSMDTIADMLGGTVYDAPDDSTYRSVVTRILTDLRYGSSSLAGEGSVDLVLIVDTTGSMGGACEALNELSGPIGAFLKAGGRIGIVNYRDVGDDFVARTDLRLSGNKGDVMAALRGLTPAGGGDLPEAAYEALEEASHMGWRSSAGKVVLLITDADAHIREPHKKKARRWFRSTGAGLAIIMTSF